MSRQFSLVPSRHDTHTGNGSSITLANRHGGHHIDYMPHLLALGSRALRVCGVGDERQTELQLTPPSLPSLVPVQCGKYCEFLAVLSLPSHSLSLTLGKSSWSR